MIKCLTIPDRIGIRKCWFLRRGEKRSTRRKTFRSKVENQQQTQPTYDTGSGNRTWDTLVGGERSHHCPIHAPMVMSLKSQSMMLPSEIIFLMSKEQSLWILQISFKACSQKLQAQQVWLSIISSFRTYPVPYSLRESLKKDITDIMKMGVKRESSSPYASPTVVVKKKDNTNQVCVDYRRLNKLTVFDPEPLPTAEHLFQKLNGYKYFTRIDLSKGY